MIWATLLLRQRGRETPSKNGRFRKQDVRLALPKSHSSISQTPFARGPRLASIILAPAQAAFMGVKRGSARSVHANLWTVWINLRISFSRRRQAAPPLWTPHMVRPLSAHSLESAARRGEKPFLARLTAMRPACILRRLFICPDSGVGS